MPTKEVSFDCKFEKCEHHKFRVVSMCAKAEDAGHYCNVVRMPVNKIKTCPLTETSKE